MARRRWRGLLKLGILSLTIARHHLDATTCRTDDRLPPSERLRCARAQPLCATTDDRLPSSARLRRAPSNDDSVLVSLTIARRHWLASEPCRSDPETGPTPPLATTGPHRADLLPPKAALH